MNILRRIGACVFTFEMAFTLFIYSGLYKKASFLTAFPVDPTLLFGLVTAVLAVFVLWRRGGRFPRASVLPANLALLFFAWMGTTALWSPDQASAAYKALQMMPLPLFSFLISALLIAPEQHRVKRFLQITEGFAVLVALATFAAYVHRGPSATSLKVMSSDYIGVGRILGLAWIIVFLNLLYGDRRLRATMLQLALLGMFGFGLLIVGSRQTLVALVLVMLLSVFRVPGFQLDWGAAERRFRLAAIVVLVLGLLVVVGLKGLGVKMSTLDRLVVLFQGGSPGASAETRLTYIHWTLDEWEKSPLVGRGLADFGTLNWLGLTPSPHVYPHNVVLEILLEGGLIGFLLFLVFVGYVVMIHLFARRGSSSSPGAVILFLVAFLGVGLLVSGTYADERIFFALLGLLCATGATPGLPQPGVAGRRRAWMKRNCTKTS